VNELLAAGMEFDVSLYELSNRHDLRPLVLRTLLTYLELMGVVRQGTPFYAGYEIRPLLPIPEIAAKFEGEPARFVSDLFAHAKAGRTWYALNPDDAAAALGQERRRVVRALEYLAEHGWAQLKTADVRQRYTRLRPSEDGAALAAELLSRCLRREAHEIARLQQVLDLVTHDGCQTNALVGYFGQAREAPCGHCTYCLTGHRQELPARQEPPPLPAALDVAAFRALRGAHPEALGEPRQSARFLCGLTSPALTRAKLSRHPLFGALEERRFGEVLDWLASGYTEEYGGRT
jgi:ATP-dependent DNA helicase RecQ